MLNIAAACGLVSTMDEFATTETPLLYDFVKAVLTLLSAEANKEHLVGPIPCWCGLPCWCEPDRKEVHGIV